MHEQIHATIKGKVQGVFMRASIKERADELQLTGSVENRDDGSVRVVAQGNEENLQKLVQFLHRGTPLAVIESVEVNWSQTSNLADAFVIRY